MNIFQELNRICITEKKVDLRNYCSIGIGGLGKFVCYPQSIGECVLLFNYLKINKQKFKIISNGTNIVFEDVGYNGVLVCFKRLNQIIIKKTDLYAFAGASLGAINNLCKKNGLGGFEWSVGIPGSLGGAIYMNAGAFGGEIKDVLQCAWVYCDGIIKKLDIEQMQMGYRKSILQNSEMIIIFAKLKLNESNVKTVEQNQRQNILKRFQSQPYTQKNCGSVFKKVGNQSAGKIIDKLGLKGVKMGGVKISNIHANFFVNDGEASSQDLHNLVNYVKNEVKQKLDIELEQEVEFVD